MTVSPGLFGTDGMVGALAEVIERAAELAETPDPRTARLRGALEGLERLMNGSAQAAGLQLALECILQLTEDEGPAELRLQQVQALARDVLCPDQMQEVLHDCG